MRKIKEVIRLQAAGLSQHQIARSWRISQSTVHAYVKAAEEAGLVWPLPEGWDEGRLEELLGRAGAAPRPQSRHPLPDFAALRQQLQQHKHLTLYLLCQEYREGHAEGYRYSRFCELYRPWRRLGALLGLFLGRRHHG